jgi:hypothetical protein
MSATIEPFRGRFFGMAAVALLAWAGMVVHNLADLPISFLSPENILPGFVWGALLLLCGAVPSARWPKALLFVWGTINPSVDSSKPAICRQRKTGNFSGGRDQ